MKTKLFESIQKIESFFGSVYSFSSSLKLYHWHVSGSGSYSQHIALDQAITSLLATTDRLVETSYAMFGDMQIVIPTTSCPSDIVKHCEDFYAHVEERRELFVEDFAQSILDEHQEAIQQLLYRLRRLQ